MKRTLALGGVAAGLLASALVTQPASGRRRRRQRPAGQQRHRGQEHRRPSGWAENAANLMGATPTTWRPRSSGSTSRPVVRPPTPSRASSPPSVTRRRSPAPRRTSTCPRPRARCSSPTGSRTRAPSASEVGCEEPALVHRHLGPGRRTRTWSRPPVSCVYDVETNKATLDYWVFVPGYYQGKTPWGIYVGKQAFTHYDFDVYEDGDRNYAFVTVYNGLQLPSNGLDRRPLAVSKVDGH